MREKLKGIDRVFCLLQSDNSPQTIQCAVVFDQTPEVGRLKSRIPLLCEFFPELKRNLIFDGDYYWEEAPQFFPDNHFEYRHLPELKNEQELLDQVAGFLSTPFVADRPLWKVLLVSNGLNLCCLSVAIHHSVADGVGGFELIRALSDDFDFDQRLVAVAGAEKSRRYLFGPSLRHLSREFCLPVFKSSLNQQHSAERKIFCARFTLDDYRSLRSRYGGTLNDCLLAQTAMAIAKLFNVQGAPMPKALRALVPISLRLPDERHALGNSLSAVSVILPTSARTFADAMQLVSEQTRELRNPKALGAYALGAELHGYAPSILQQRLAGLSARWTNLICSNFPGPRTKLMFVGVAGQYLVGSVALLKGHSLGLLYASYGKTVTIGITADATVAAHCEQLPQFFSEAIASAS